MAETLPLTPADYIMLGPWMVTIERRDGTHTTTLYETFRAAAVGWFDEHTGVRRKVLVDARGITVLGWAPTTTRSFLMTAEVAEMCRIIAPHRSEQIFRLEMASRASEVMATWPAS